MEDVFSVVGRYELYKSLVVLLLVNELTLNERVPKWTGVELSGPLIGE